MGGLRCAWFVVAVLSFAACQRPEAYVECRANGATLSAGQACALEHRAGSRPLHACWTISVSCANGTKGSAEGCGDVEPQAKATVMVPFAAFRGALDKCDQVSGANVGAMHLTEK